ncbi:MAG: hypothetical protein AB8B84_03750 [Granulosicoccus sp.]
MIADTTTQRPVQRDESTLKEYREAIRLALTFNTLGGGEKYFETGGVMHCT